MVEAKNSVSNGSGLKERRGSFFRTYNTCNGNVRSCGRNQIGEGTRIQQKMIGKHIKRT